MAEHFDLLVVGTGAAAVSVAYPCRSAGWDVAVVDDRPFGGTCVNRGCDPKKVLVGAADLADWARRMRGRGCDRRPGRAISTTGLARGEGGFKGEWFGILLLFGQSTTPRTQEELAIRHERLGRT